MRTPKHLTQRAILRRIRHELGLTANVVAGEYRINYRQHDPRYRPESDTNPEHPGTAYFATDPGDALATAAIMARVKMPSRIEEPATAAPTTDSVVLV